MKIGGDFVGGDKFTTSIGQQFNGPTSVNINQSPTDSESASAAFQRGKALLDQSRFDKARDCFAKAAVLDPDNFDAVFFQIMTMFLATPCANWPDADARVIQEQLTRLASNRRYEAAAEWLLASLNHDRYTLQGLRCSEQSAEEIFKNRLWPQVPAGQMAWLSRVPVSATFQEILRAYGVQSTRQSGENNR